MLWPTSTVRPLCFCPTIRASACLIRARSAVNGVDGAPTPNPATATRSDGASRSMNALAALLIAIAPPNRMFG